MYEWMAARELGGSLREERGEAWNVGKGLSQENIYPNLQFPEAISMDYEQKSHL